MNPFLYNMAFWRRYVNATEPERNVLALASRHQDRLDHMSDTIA
jgi:hypothetical protein